MQIYLDTADLNEIKKTMKLGTLTGVTTNPTLIAKEVKRLEILGQMITFESVVSDILDIFNGKVNVEVISKDADGMIEEAMKLSELSKNIVIKIPITSEGLKAINALNMKEVKTNATLVFSVNQAILAAKAGADYVSIFVGRLDDIGHDGIQVVSDTIKIFNLYNIETQVIAASIRHPLHVIELAKTGAHIVTIPFNIIEKMFKHPLTDIGIERFLKDWEAIKNG